MEQPLLEKLSWRRQAVTADSSSIGDRLALLLGQQQQEEAAAGQAAEKAQIFASLADLPVDATLYATCSLESDQPLPQLPSFGSYADSLRWCWVAETRLSGEAEAAASWCLGAQAAGELALFYAWAGDIFCACQAGGFLTLPHTTLALRKLCRSVASEAATFPQLLDAWTGVASDGEPASEAVLPAGCLVPLLLAIGSSLRHACVFRFQAGAPFLGAKLQANSVANCQRCTVISQQYDCVIAERLLQRQSYAGSFSLQAVLALLAVCTGQTSVLLTVKQRVGRQAWQRLCKQPDGSIEATAF